MTESPKQHMWYYTRQSLLHGGEQGPYTELQILELAKLGKIQLDTLLRSPTKTNNQEILAESIPKLAIAINQAEIDAEAKRQAELEQRKEEKRALAEKKKLANQEIVLRKTDAIPSQLERPLAPLSGINSGVTLPPINSDASQPSTRALLNYHANSKSAGIAYAAWFFFGMFGAHRFYCGKIASGAAQLSITLLSLLLCLVFIGVFPLFGNAIWVFVDLFLISGWVRDYNTRIANLVS
ncbi:MAG: NINE protein [Pirellula sp.]|jgi:TM2 domain-containing membrane protein YozV